MKKATIVLFFCSYISLTLPGQAPSISWKQTLGGTGLERCNAIQQTTDGGYIVAGDAGSNNGDVTGNHGAIDCWIIKLSSSGVMQWQKALGGTLTEVANSVQQTFDGGYIFAGQSSSNNGDVTGHHGSTSTADYWIVKLDTIGNIDWQKSLGGSGYDYANCIMQTSDSGYIVTGLSSSSDGDVTGHHGSTYDCWVVKLDSIGTIQWQNSLGGTESEGGYSIQQTTDNGYIVAGTSASNDGDVTVNLGLNDFWIVKLDAMGSIEWQKSIGGTQSEVPSDIKQTIDGGYIIGGRSSSNDIDVTENHGLDDYWVVKLDITGIIQWQKSYGSTGIEGISSLQQTSDGGYILGGSADSLNGDVIGTHARDYWLLKIDTVGTIEWQVSLGGSYADWANCIQQTSDSGYVVAGSTYSIDGDVIGNHGSFDFWVVKLSAQTNSIEYHLNESNFSVYPNPAKNEVFVEAKLLPNEKGIISIYDLNGKLLLSDKLEAGNNKVKFNMEDFASGVYYYRLFINGEAIATEKLVMQR